MDIYDFYILPEFEFLEPMRTCASREKDASVSDNCELLMRTCFS